jgi:thiamine kinase-like enzyme
MIMSVDAKRLLLDEFELREKQFLGESLDLSELEKLVSDLLKVASKDKAYFKNYALGFAERLFTKSIELSGLKELRSLYLTPIKIEKKAEEIKKQKISFDETLKKFASAVPNLLSLKNSFFIELAVDETSDYVCVVLHDDNYFINPFRKIIEEKINPIHFTKISDADSFLKEFSSNFICLVLISPRVNDAGPLHEIRSGLKQLIDTFGRFAYITIKDLNAPFSRFYSKNTDVDNFLDEVGTVTERFLSNSDLDFEEEKIIKTLFKETDFPLLDYRILKGGKSGAKVVEITPKRKTADSSGKKYVVKISRDKEKIRREIQSFKIHVEDIQNLGKKYQMSNAATVNFEGIKYTYASDSKFSSSFSLSEIIDNDNHPFHNKKMEIIDKIFQENCFEIWKKELREVTMSVGDIYSRYLKMEDTLKVIAKIDNKTIEEVRESEFVTDLKKLLNVRLKTRLKVCHGDLHTGNFLIDETDQTYLIDFGFTDDIHAVIDHATLECSLKFNHTPRYVKLDEFLSVEREFLNADSFYPTFQIKATKRVDLIGFYTMINKIRSSSIDCTFDQVSRQEYFVSLLMITFRQVGYSDLNQLFAWNSAQLLMRHIKDIVSFD